MSLLFSLKIRPHQLDNRIIVAPMSIFSTRGLPNRMAHYALRTASTIWCFVSDC